MRAGRIAHEVVMATTALMVTVSLQGPLPALAQAPSPSAAVTPFTPGSVAPALLSMPADDDLATGAALVVPGTPPAPPDEIDLLAMQQRAQAQARAMPARDWGIRALVEALAYDPMAAFAFVRDSIALDPYRGVLRGARGTLAARAGSSADRAVLLKALLDEMLVPARFATGRLDSAASTRLLDRAFTRPAAPLAEAPLDPRAADTLAAVATRARRDYARLRAALGDRIGAMDGAANSVALDDLETHAWVQMLYGTTWLDLDPSLPESRPGETLTSATATMAELPASERQAVVLTVTAETLSGGSLETRLVLEHRIDAASSGGQDIYLTFQPEISSLGGSITEALGSAVQWQPALYVGSEDVELGMPFPVRPERDLFDGTESGPVVSALRLEIGIETPGAAPSRHGRVLLDRVPRDLRGAPDVDPAALRPLAVRDGLLTELGVLHHLQLSNGGLNARSNAVWRGIAANFIGAIMLDESRLADIAMPAALLPLTVADESLVLDSEWLIRRALDAEPDVRAFVALPRVFISSIGPAADGPGSISQTDLLADSVRVLTRGVLGPADGARRQLWYGALQGALETQLGLERAAVSDPATRRQSSTSLGFGDAPSVLDEADGDALAEDADPALVSDLRAGRLVVVGGDPGEARTWWSVDPRDGSARAVLSPGLGGWWNYQNHTPNSGPRITVPDPATNPDYYDYNKIMQELEREEAAAAARNAPRQVCLARNEYGATLCVSQTAFYAFVVIGVTVAVVVLVTAIVI